MISGRISARENLRYTPGGLPIVRFRIEHLSKMIEAGSEREVACALSAVAIGEIAAQVPPEGFGSPVAVRGFLCRTGLNDERLVLHVDAIKAEPADPVSSGNV